MLSLQLSITGIHNIQCFLLVNSLQNMAGKKIKFLKSDLFLEWVWTKVIPLSRIRAKGNCNDSLTPVKSDRLICASVRSHQTLTKRHYVLMYFLRLWYFASKLWPLNAWLGSYTHSMGEVRALLCSITSDVLSWSQNCSTFLYLHPVFEAFSPDSHTFFQAFSF